MRITFDCPGCEAAANDEPGVPHTCEASGTPSALDAHDAGAVEPLEVLPVHGVVLEFRVHSSGPSARKLVDQYAELIAQHPAVLAPVTVAVNER